MRWERVTGSAFFANEEEVLALARAAQGTGPDWARWPYCARCRIFLAGAGRLRVRSKRQIASAVEFVEHHQPFERARFLGIRKAGLAEAIGKFLEKLGGRQRVLR